MKPFGPVLAFLRPRGPERELRGERPRPARLCRLLLALTLTFTTSLLPAVELTPGLVYLRPGTELTPQTGSAILDLRAPMDDAALVPLLAAIAPGSNNAQRVVLVLMSPDTPLGVRKHIALLPRCITVGRSEPGLKTDITVTTTAEADQSAIEALATGTAPEKLLVENADKRRFDEASLIREHSGEPDPLAVAPTLPNENVTGKSADPAAPSSSEPAASAPKPDAPAPVDAVLQRALHLYRGLVVLKKA